MPIFISFTAALAAPAQTPCVNGMAGPYACSNVDLLGQLSVTQLGSVTSAADIWGWTDPLNGKEYAVCGTRTGTAFVDISTPTAPVVIGFLPRHIGTGSLWFDVDVSGNWCYVGSETSGHGVQVFDLTRLRTAVPVATFTEDGYYGGISHSHTIHADKSHPYVYAVGTNLASGGLVAINVSNPASPALAGTYSTDGYIHENMVITYNGPDATYAGHEISFNFHGNQTNKITIVDVTDKSDMTRISAIQYNTNSGYYSHQGWVTPDHKFLLMDDEWDEVNHGNTTRTRVFNIQDLDAPVFMYYYDGPNASADHNLYVHQDLVFESNYTSGLQILDATNVSTGPLSMSAWFDTYPSNNGTSYNGAWGNYPFFASGVVVVSDIQSGLFILRPRLSLRLKVKLEGPFDQVSGLMRDSLRVKGMIPATEPYTALGLPPLNSPAIGSPSGATLAITGSNAIVDWVDVELRDAADPTIVRARTIGLLQRDGDVVRTDGTSPVQFSVATQDYYIAVRHRNHLGVMTAAPKRVSVAEKTYDLSNGSVALYGTQPTKPIGAVNVLWAGNVMPDHDLKYTGTGNDRDPILTAIGGVIPTNTTLGYAATDVNMDGVTKYTGGLNDRDPILSNIGGVVPTTTRAEQLP